MKAKLVESSRESELSGPYRAGTSILARLGDHNLVFSEYRQAVYRLDERAAFIWRCLDADLSPNQIERELVHAGMAIAEARRAVSASLDELQPLGTDARSLHDPVSRAPPAELVPLSIAGATVGLHVSQELLADVREAFGHLETDSRQSDVQLCVRVNGDSVHFLPPGQTAWTCDRSNFVPVLKGELINSVLKSAQYEVALHAAAVAQNDGILLLVGSPGAGKTTLAAALASSGFDVISDDVVLMDREGRLRGLPFYLTAKAPSWPLLSSCWPELAFEPSYPRPDGHIVSYLGQIPLACSRPRQLEIAILLDRRDHGPSSAHDLDPCQLLEALIREGATHDEQLKATGFMSLVNALRNARCCRIIYSDLSAGVDTVRSLLP